MEALNPQLANEANETRHAPNVPVGYLAQPDMRELISAALALGWQLVGYEADPTRKPPGLPRLSVEEANWREDQQARNLRAAIEQIPDDERLLVWCGNGHLAKRAGTLVAPSCESGVGAALGAPQRLTGELVPMAARFAEQAAVEPFAIDQTPTVTFVGDGDPDALRWVEAYASEIQLLDGAAGFLSEHAPEGWPSFLSADAFILALDNDLQ